MNQRFSDSNIARHTNKRRYVRKDRNTVDDGTRNDMYGVSAEERARRLMMVEKIRAHEALMKMVPR